MLDLRLAFPAGSETREVLPFRPAAFVLMEADAEPLGMISEVRCFLAGRADTAPSPSTVSRWLAFRRFPAVGPAVVASGGDEAEAVAGSSGMSWMAGPVSRELIATTSSLSTSWGRDLANSARELDDRMYSAAHDRRSFRIEEFSGVSFQAWTRRGVAGMEPVV